MRLMGSAPPSSSTIAELACSNEIARQHRVASPLTREVSDNHRGENCDVPEGPPIGRANRWLFSYRVHGYTHGDSLIGDFVDIGFFASAIELFPVAPHNSIAPVEGFNLRSTNMFLPAW
jgi:hypothetical protein